MTRTRVRRGTAPTLLLEAARDLFAERGYRRTTTKEVAERAGVSENLIFRYYGSKADLLAAAVIRPLTGVIDDYVRAFGTDESRGTKDDHDLVRDFVEVVYDLLADNRGLALALFTVLTEQPEELDLEELRGALTGVIATTIPPLGDYLRAGGHRTTDVGLTLRTGLLMVGSAAVLLPATYPAGAEAPDRGAVVDELTHFVRHGLRTPPA